MSYKQASYYFETTANQPFLNIIMHNIHGYGWYPFLLTVGDALYYICAAPNIAQNTITPLSSKQIALGSNNKLKYIGQARDGNNIRIKVEGMDSESNTAPYPMTFMPMRPGILAGSYLTSQ